MGHPQNPHLQLYLLTYYTMHKPSFKRENYITDSVGHTNTRINIDDFNKKFREWEIRRGFRTEEDITPMRGMALRSAKRKSSVSAA